MKFTAYIVKGNIADTNYGSAFSAPCRFNKNFISKNALVYCHFANEDGMVQYKSLVVEPIPAPFKNTHPIPTPPSLLPIFFNTRPALRPIPVGLVMPFFPIFVPDFMKEGNSFY